MDSKKVKELKKAIGKTLNHEDLIQHDKNDQPITFAAKKIE